MGALLLAACSNSGTVNTGPSGVVTCSGDAGSPVTGFDSESSTLGTCNNPIFLRGTATPGASCRDSSDCAPSCCSCPTGSKESLGALCVNGVCASPMATCCAFVASLALPIAEGGLAPCQ